MGKRKKSSRGPVVRPKPKLDKQFSCIFCNHEKTVEVRLDKESKVGSISCRVCSASWQTPIHYLSDAVDVYSEWIDACEAAQREEEQNASHYDYDGDRSRRHNDGYSDGEEADDTQWRRQGHASSSRHLGGVDEDDEDDDDSLFG